MTFWEVVLLVICIALVVTPARYDIAIRWKERNERLREEAEKKRREDRGEHLR